MFDDLSASVSLLNQNTLETQALNLLADVFLTESLGKAALVSSFGAESAVLLHLVSRIDRKAPILFIDTQILFPQTIEYQTELATWLGLTGVIRIQPSQDLISAEDPQGRLHRSDPDACCNLKKKIPLEKALSGYDAWITGRKRHQAASREKLQVFEADSTTGRVKLNPLAFWSPEDVKAYIERYDLPRHPLVDLGYPSIGCMPCTSTVKSGEDPRSGRWRGIGKTECGIHGPTLTQAGEV